MYGIATPLPFQPASLGWAANPNASNACGFAFPGLTIWNGTIPLFHGSYASGTAPFWQFLFFSNATRQLASGTDVNQTVRVDPPISMTSWCALVMAADGTPWGWADYDVSPLTADSPQMAQAAWGAGGSAEWVGRHRPSAEMYLFGQNDWPGWTGGVMVAFQRCGLLGVGGTQPYATTYVQPDGSFSFEVTGQVTCTPEDSLAGPPIPIDMEFSNGTSSLNGSSEEVVEALWVGLGSNPRLLTFGLDAWMVRLDLLDSQGQALQSAASACPTWVSSLGKCVDNPSGWYAVLFTQNGSWIDSYPSSTNETGWSSPAGALLGDDLLAIVTPSSWNVTGDSLVVNETTPAVPVSGVVTLP